METELFDRYIHEVGRRLPKKQRTDVQAELHSLLMDALQDRMVERGTEDEPATEADQVVILEEYGPPAEMAARYRPPHRYLIGPRVYDWYRIVVAAVSGSITLAHLVLLCLSLWGDPEPLRALGPTLGKVFDGYLGALLAGFGSVTLTFAILERVLPESVYEQDETMWDPRTLPEIQDRTRIEVGGLVVEIVLLVFALTLFNLFPEWVGVGFVGSIDGSPVRWHSMPLLSSSFFTIHLPWLNVLWVASIGLNLVLLHRGRWQRLTRTVDFVLTVCGAIILYRMVFGSPILTIEAVQPESLRRVLDSILLGLLKVGLVIGFIATIGEAIHKLYLIFRTLRVSSYPLDAHEPGDRTGMEPLMNTDTSR